MAALGIAAHATALRAGFVWLDHAHLTTGLAVRPPSEWLALFREPFAGTGYYRPLTALSLSVDALIGTPLPFHCVNLGLHAAAAMLLLLAAEALGVTRRAATLGALLFAAHPVGSLVAGAIAFRSESLIACGLYGLALAHVKGRPGWAVLALSVAGLSKETGLALAPLVVLVLETERRGARRWPLLGAEAGAFAVALGLRLAWAPPLPGGGPALGLSDALGTRLAAFAKSVALLILPAERSICDAFPVTAAHAPLAIVGGLLAIGLVALSWRERSLGLLTALALLPSLQLAPTLRWWSPHYLYVAAGWFFALVARRVERRGATTFALTLALTGVLGVLSWRDGRRYRNDDTLWRPEVLREPACREGHFYLADAARARGDRVAALSHFEAALRLEPRVLAFVDLDAALTNYGRVLFEAGRYDHAQSAFEAALERTPDGLARRKLDHNIAAARLASGDPAGAVARLEVEARRPDPLAESLGLYARALDALGRRTEAADVRRRAAELHQPR
ncbi:MAG: tetratricopeptide repeat protein [Polyangiaceae bacterium]|nr:tetratricopeptide repeat protein [Polyangiaceae bacterium]